MPDYNIRTTFEGPTGDTADRLVYSWGINSGGMGQALLDAIAFEIEDSWTLAPVAPATSAMKSHIQTPYRMLFHEAFAAQGGPAIAIRDAYNSALTQGAGISGPTEVQLVVSRMTASARGPIATGRIYYGPIPGQQTKVATTALMNNLLGHAKNLHNRLVGLGVVPVVLAKQGTILATGKPIIAYKIDQLYDTQRRRGQKTPAPNTSLTVTV
jgi:hypothetical protein